MRISLSSLGVMAAMSFAIGTIGCAPEDVGDDTDNNRNESIDGIGDDGNGPPEQGANRVQPGPSHTQCTYPVPSAEVTLGVRVGDTVPSSLSWQGYAPGAVDPSTIHITDFFNCDGSMEVDAILVDTSQFG